jgi:predicted HTH transcriptional regulator
METTPAEIPATTSETKPLPVVTPAIETIEDYSLMRPSKGFMAWLRAKAQAALRALRQKKLDRLMTLFEKKPQVTNDMVEKFLRVSHPTATKYLNILVKEGKLKRLGQGSAIHYEKI